MRRVEMFRIIVGIAMVITGFALNVTLHMLAGIPLDNWKQWNQWDRFVTMWNFSPALFILMVAVGLFGGLIMNSGFNHNEDKRDAARKAALKAQD